MFIAKAKRVWFRPNSVFLYTGSDQKYSDFLWQKKNLCRQKLSGESLWSRWIWKNGEKDSSLPFREEDVFWIVRKTK